MQYRCQLVKGVVQGHGNKRSKSNVKTKRMFKVNLHKGRFYSYTLKVYVNLNIRNRTRRTIDKYGDLDSFVVGTPARKLTDYGVRLRKQVIQKRAEQASVAA